MIEEEVQERNPVIANNQDEAEDGIAQIDDSIEALIQQEKMFDEMSASLIADFTTVKVSSMPKDSLLNMINSYPKSLPADTQQCCTDESKLTDLDLTIASLEDNMASLLGNLNVSLGQDFDIPLTLKAAPEPDLEEIGSMDYDTDLDKALTNSILVRMEESYTMQEQQRREIALDFDTRYKDVQEKVKTWNKEKDKLQSEQASYVISQKSFELGFISPLSLDIASQSVQKQLENTEKAKTDLVEAYTGYQWLLGGVKL